MRPIVARSRLDVHWTTGRPSEEFPSLWLCHRLPGCPFGANAEFISSPTQPQQSQACFPVVSEEVKELFQKLQGLQETEKQISSEIVEHINQIKSHLIRAEDARYYNG